MNEAEDKSKIWSHRWGMPILHACLWVIGLLVTTDIWNVLGTYFPKESEQYAVSIGAVVVIFFLEIVLTFIDCAIEKENLSLNITFCKFVALLITTLVAIVVFMFLGCNFLSRTEMQIPGKIMIAIVILISAFTKGMEMWLQNNWDKYTVDDVNKMPELTFSI